MFKQSKKEWALILVLFFSVLSILPFNASAENTNSNVYTDTASGVSFVIPDKWEQKEMSQSRQYLTAKFVSSKDLGYTILFGATDAWNQLSSSEKLGHNRKDFNNDYFSKADIAEILETTENNITIETYNGIQYYRSESTVSQEIYGITISLQMDWLLHIENGWMYMFLFSGIDSNDSISDFKTLINSVVYPTVSDTDGHGDTNKTILVVSGILIIVSLATLMLFKRFRNKQSSKNALVTNTAFDTPDIQHEPIILNSSIICKNCGQLLPSDSEYCHICGSKVETSNQ